MTWTLDNTRIFVDEKSSEHKQIIARLQPLMGGTIHHVFGYEDWIFKIRAYVVGNSDLAHLLGLVETGETCVFSGPYGQADVYVNSISVKDQKSIYQTLRSDLDCDSPVYIIDMELYREEDV